LPQPPRAGPNAVPHDGYGVSMASDIVIVLRGEHRQLRLAAERCSRTARGLEDPFGDLRAALLGHVEAMAVEVNPALPENLDNWQARQEQLKACPDAGLVDAAQLAVALERDQILPLLQELPVSARRRLGRAFRIRRAALDRTHAQAAARRRSAATHSELYELARQAGIQQRSRMTKAELLRAVRVAKGQQDQEPRPSNS